MTFFGRWLQRLGAAVRRFWQALFGRKGRGRDAFEKPGSAGLLETSALHPDAIDAQFEVVEPGAEEPPPASDPQAAEEEWVASEPEPVAEAKPEPTAEAKPEPTAEAKPEPTAEAKPEPSAEDAARQEAQRKAAEERARLRAEREAEIAAFKEEERRKREELKAQREAEKETRRLEREAAQKAKEEEKRRKEEEREAARLAREEAKRRKEEEREAKRRAKEEEKRRKEEEERLRLEAEAEAERQRLEAEAEAARIAAIEVARRREEVLENVPNDYVPAPDSSHELLQVDVGQFAGPLDLLLFLIRRHKVDIFDIPIAFVLERYLEHIRMMQELNIDVAAEFMFMAAELLHIKSKMLLPTPAEVEDEEEEDPRAELVRRLLEYQKYKEAALGLAKRTWLGRDVFDREPERIEMPRNDSPLREVGVFALIEAFDNVLQRQKPEIRHQVMMEHVSVSERIRTFVGVLVGNPQTRFEELITGYAARLDIIVSFLALLEMTKFQMLQLYQSADGVLFVSPRFDTSDEALHHLDAMMKAEEPQYAG